MFSALRGLKKKGKRLLTSHGKERSGNVADKDLSTLFTKRILITIVHENVFPTSFKSVIHFHMLITKLGSHVSLTSETTIDVQKRKQFTYTSPKRLSHSFGKVCVSECVYTRRNSGVYIGRKVASC